MGFNATSVGILKDAITLTRDGGSHVRITVLDADPQRAAKVAGRVGEGYLNAVNWFGVRAAIYLAAVKEGAEDAQQGLDQVMRRHGWNTPPAFPPENAPESHDPLSGSDEVTRLNELIELARNRETDEWVDIGVREGILDGNALAYYRNGLASIKELGRQGRTPDDPEMVRVVCLALDGIFNLSGGRGTVDRELRLRQKRALDAQFAGSSSVARRAPQEETYFDRVVRRGGSAASPSATKEAVQLSPEVSEYVAAKEILDLMRDRQQRVTRQIAEISALLPVVPRTIVKPASVPRMWAKPDMVRQSLVSLAIAAPGIGLLWLARWLGRRNRS